MNAHNYFTYILECIDKSYYVGVTNDLELRIDQHNAGFDAAAYTFTKRPVILRYFERFQFIQHAIEREKQWKGWNRKKKEALFNEDWQLLKELAKNNSLRHEDKYDRK